MATRPLREADIAVLTRTNREAQLMQEAMSELKIPSVLYSTGNLFDTHEAMEMSRVLEGIASPHDERAHQGGAGHGYDGGERRRRSRNSSGMRPGGKRG